MPKVTFQPADLTVEVKEGASLLKAAQKAKVPLRSSCGGNAICTTCRCVVQDDGGNLSAIDETEQDFLSASKLPPPWRLACQAKVSGDVICWVRPDETELRPELNAEMVEVVAFEQRAKDLRDALRTAQRKPWDAVPTPSSALGVKT